MNSADKALCTSATLILSSFWARYASSDATGTNRPSTAAVHSALTALLVSWYWKCLCTYLASTGTAEATHAASWRSLSTLVLSTLSDSVSARRYTSNCTARAIDALECSITSFLDPLFFSAALAVFTLPEKALAALKTLVNTSPSFSTLPRAPISSLLPFLRGFFFALALLVGAASTREPTSTSLRICCAWSRLWCRVVIAIVPYSTASVLLSLCSAMYAAPWLSTATAFSRPSDRETTVVRAVVAALSLALRLLEDSSVATASGLLVLADSAEIARYCHTSLRPPCLLTRRSCIFSAKSPPTVSQAA
eukprot:Colp12_sorted_trinity150504_noHs@29675